MYNISMTERVPQMFKVLREPPTFPGYRGGNGYVENLTSYREDAVIDERGVVIKEALQFDIERHVEWDSQYKLRPFTYSMMIDGYYPISRFPFRRRKVRPTLEEFDETIATLNEFILDDRITLEYNGLRVYRNPSQNIFVDWSIDSGKKICVGVIQEEPVSDLAVVTDIIVPYAISVFNIVSPTKKISQNIVDESVREARKAHLIIPRRRI